MQCRSLSSVLLRSTPFGGPSASVHFPTLNFPRLMMVIFPHSVALCKETYFLLSEAPPLASITSSLACFFSYYPPDGIFSWLLTSLQHANVLILQLLLGKLTRKRGSNFTETMGFPHLFCFSLTSSVPLYPHLSHQLLWSSFQDTQPRIGSCYTEIFSRGGHTSKQLVKCDASSRLSTSPTSWPHLRVLLMLTSVTF